PQHQPEHKRPILNENTNRRAVCGKTACTVRREGRGFYPSVPTPIFGCGSATLCSREAISIMELTFIELSCGAAKSGHARQHQAGDSVPPSPIIRSLFLRDADD